MRALITLALASHGCSALLLPSATRTRTCALRSSVAMEADETDERSPEFRAAQAANRAATADARRETAAALECSAEEVAALTQAAKSFDACWSGPEEELPAELKSMFNQKPLGLINVLRNPTEDPDARVWLKVREKWPVLSERSDDDLLAMLQPIKDVKIDFRAAQAEAKAAGRFPEGYKP